MQIRHGIGPRPLPGIGFAQKQLAPHGVIDPRLCRDVVGDRPFDRPLARVAEVDREDLVRERCILEARELLLAGKVLAVDGAAAAPIGAGGTAEREAGTRGQPPSLAFAIRKRKAPREVGSLSLLPLTLP